MPTYSGVFSGRSAYTLELIVNQGSQSVDNNTTQVSFTLRIVESPEWGSWSNNSATYSINIDGNTYSGSFTYDFRNYNTLTLRTGTVTIGHNSDGTKTVSASASVGGGTTIGNASASGSFALTTIPRASNSTFSVSAVDAGTAFTINTNRASTSFTHTLRYSFGTLSNQTIATGVGASHSWTPPLSLLNQIPNATSGTMTITTLTYSGGTLIGTTSRNITLRAPSEIIPDFTTITVSENVSLVATEVGAYVQNLSRLNLAITGAVGTYGSTISSYQITVGSTTINAASGVSGAINLSGTVTITGRVTDSRGRVRTRTVNITMLAYSEPVVDVPLLRVRRSDAVGTLAEEGIYLRVDLVASVASLVNSTQRNAISYRVLTKVRGAATWSVVADVTPGGISFNSFDVVAGTYAVTQSYDVRVEVKDKFSTVIIDSTLATATVAMDWAPGGVGVGKFWQQGALDVAGQIYQNNGRQVLDALSPLNASNLSSGETPNSTLPPRIRIASRQVSGDWNSYTENGWYDGSNLANRPPGTAWVYVHVQRHSNSDAHVLQTAYHFSENIQWVRTRSNNAWNSWVRTAAHGQGGAPFAMAAGFSGGVTVPAGGNHSASITFPSGRFNVAPRVMTNLQVEVRDVTSSASGITASGFTLNRGNTGSAQRTGVTAAYIAVQMTPTAASG